MNINHKDLRKRALKSIDETKWIPDWGHDKIYNLVNSRPDWCLSRQRSWGVPIPALYCEKCDYGWLPLDYYDELLGKVREKGVDVWFSMGLKDIFSKPIECPKCKNPDVHKEQDILDVWFDAGSSWRAVLQQRNNLTYPSDLYLEAGDQHRGWFQLSLLPSVAIENKSPFKGCATHGLVLDEQGKKMSKSLGNVISPHTIIQKNGADVLRLWFASVDFTTDVNLSDKILEPIGEAYFKIRNTARFLLGNISDYNSVTDAVSYDLLLPIDKWALHRLQILVKECTEAYDEFDFHRVYSKLYNFAVVDLSSIYLDVLKDRLYTYGKNSIGRRAGQTVMYEIAHSITRIMAPIMPYTSDEIWSHLGQSENSVHLTEFPKVNESYLNKDIEEEWEKLLEIREEVTKTLELARKDKKIGHPLDARVLLSLEQTSLNGIIQKYENDLRFLFIVSQVQLTDNIPSDSLSNYQSDDIKGLEIGVVPATGKKCARCWNYSDLVGKDESHPEICERCLPVILEMV